MTTPVPPSKVSPLTFNVPIADKNGNPTPFFSRQLAQLLAEKQDVAQTASDAQATANAAVPTSALLAQLIAALGGDPGQDTLLWWDHAALAFQLLKLGANLSIASGVLNAAGGGGGSLPWYFKPPTAANFSTMYASLRGGSISNALALANDSHAGMSWVDNSTDSGYMKAVGRPIPAGNRGPGTTFTITAHVTANSIAGNEQFGIWARCNANQYVFLDVFDRGGTANIQRCYYNSGWNDGNYGLTWRGRDAWIRLVISNQTTSYYVSADGVNWVQCYTSENLFSAPFTDYGFCMGRFDTNKYFASCDSFTSDEYP